MQLLRDHASIPINIKRTIATGEVVDDRIETIERIVANHYHTTVHELDVFYKDSEAKIMCCFLLHDLLRYNIGSLAVKYKINKLFLQNKILKTYCSCLQDETYMELINGLRDSYLFSDKKLQEAVDSAF